MSPDRRRDKDRRSHPSGGRRARRAYSARPYLAQRDAAFYALLWTAGLVAYGGGVDLGGQVAAAALWAAWLFLGWTASRWLRRSEDFDSAAANALTSPWALGILGVALPVLAALGAMAATAGRLWWEPFGAAALVGMALAAPVAFLDRSFTVGAFWAAVALLGGLGHPHPAALRALLVLPALTAYLTVSLAQSKAFRHFPEGPVPPSAALGRDLREPLLAALVALGLSWAWTPALEPRPVEILPRMSLSFWMSGEGRDRKPIALFGPPAKDDMGGIAAGPSVAASGLSGALEGLMARLPQVLGGAMALALLLGAWVWWRKRKRAEQEAVVEARKRETIRGAGVSVKKRAPLSAPADPREAVVYYYNRLRADLAALGVPKEEAKTPAEYAQALSSSPLAGDAPLDEFTEIFHRAEYSHHAVGEGEKARASECYERTVQRVAGAKR